MAPALYGSERRYYRRKKHINNTKRSQASPNSYMTDFSSSNFHALEIIGEVDANAQRMAECQGSGIPLAGSGIGCNSISISNYTKAERKQIKTWLYSELERVHDLMSRLEARELDLRECRQMPELDSCGSSSKSVCEALPIPGAISQNEDFELDFDREQNPKSRRGVKRSLQSKGDTLATKWQKVDIKGKKTADLMRRCGTILRKLMSHEFSWPFNQPVDVVKLNLPDYRQIITKPMDLGTIESKLHDKVYSSPLEFAEDVRLTFANAMKYNPKEQDAHIMAAVLCQLFERSWRPFSKKLEQLIVDCDNHQAGVATEDMLPSPPTVLPHAAVTVQSHKETNSGTDHLSYRQMTHEEKKDVAKMLEDVEPDQVDHVIEIFRRKNPNLKLVDGEVTLDLDSLDSQSLWEIYSLLRGSKKSVKKQTPKQPHCGEVSEGDVNEEDVDIGIDIPTSSFPPVVIDRDDSVTSKRSSSSSSGDSGSSSSGSDSDSSSESEADADDAQSPGLVNGTSPEKEPMGSGDEQKASPPVTTDGAKRPSRDIDQEASLTRGDATGATQEGGVTVPERQLLPQRLDRASLLKHRFADTILKAREKTLPLKNAGADPDKLKREKEELERLQREKKARLHAEAKLAEEVRRKAEAAVAAKARCQREAERQAARQALEQVEKTVGQSENFDLLKDLEMLGRASLGHPSVSRSAEDASNCACLQEHPLEQLGLFMKVDDDHFF